MIPKIINYCWFGHNPLPDEAKKYIASWKKYFPNYELKEWNEDNFDLHICPYVEEAYKAKKWAFVSDYARFWILYNYGGLYFDTDVEVIRNMDFIVDSGPFMGREADCDNGVQVNPGLGIGTAPGNPFYKEMLEYYSNLHFLGQDGQPTGETVVDYTTSILRRHGYKGNDGIENIEGINIYPPDFFCPQNYITGNTDITKNTVTIHHYSESWHSNIDRFIHKIERCDNVAHPVEAKIRRMISFPFRIVSKYQKLGFKEAIIFSFSKLRGGTKK